MSITIFWFLIINLQSLIFSSYAFQLFQRNPTHSKYCTTSKTAGVVNGRLLANQRVGKDYHPQRTTTPRNPLLKSNDNDHNDDSSSSSSPWTLQQLEEYADKTGVVISFTTLGPGYRAVARAKHDESLILGYVEGFVRPSGTILHLDKMEVFQPILKKAKYQMPESFDFGGISFGVGLLAGYRCLLHGVEKGCSIAEFLAIDDEEFQHKRLVRYYKRVGFNVVKYVGEELQDVPDRLVWGGCGTLMKEECRILEDKWTKLLTLMKSRTESK